MSPTKFIFDLSISMREVIITSILQGFDQKHTFFERWSLLKFNNLVLILGMVLKFYSSVAKGLKLSLRKALSQMFDRVLEKPIKMTCQKDSCGKTPAQRCQSSVLEKFLISCLLPIDLK